MNLIGKFILVFVVLPVIMIILGFALYDRIKARLYKNTNKSDEEGKPKFIPFELSKSICAAMADKIRQDSRKHRQRQDSLQKKDLKDKR